MVEGELALRWRWAWRFGGGTDSEADKAAVGLRLVIDDVLCDVWSFELLITVQCLSSSGGKIL
jgi:hypothetical protein